MGERIKKRIIAFLKKWPSWIIQFLFWILLLIRDNYATELINWFGNSYGHRILSAVLSIIPKDISGWAFFILVISMALIFAYDFFEAWKEKRDRERLQKTLEQRPLIYFQGTVHLEYKVNADAEIVNNYLLQNYAGTRFNRQVKFNNKKYVVEYLQHFEPRKDNIFQYGFVASGYEITEDKGNTLTKDIDNLFTVIVSQGQRGISILSFDTNHKHCHMFTTELVQELMKGFIVELVNQGSRPVTNFVTISNSSRTNDNRIILTVQKKIKNLVHNCHAKITRIQYKPFQKPEYKDIQTTNKNLKWDSIESQDGCITLRNREDLELAWAKDTKSFDEEKFGFSYILTEEQNLLEGYYKVDVSIFGEKDQDRELFEVANTFLISFHSIADMKALFRGHNHRKKSIVVFHEDMMEKLTPDQFDSRFTIQMSKSQFERELGSLVSALDDASVLERPIFLLRKWAILQRKRTTAEMALSQSGGLYAIVQNVNEADIIKLIKEPYRGLVLELSETPVGLWISVIPEGHIETIDTIRKENRDGWESVKTRRMPVNEDAYLNLLKWLQSLQSTNES